MDRLIRADEQFGLALVECAVAALSEKNEIM
jgi:hypothetical protein